MSKYTTFVSGIFPFEILFESYKFKLKCKRNYPIHIVFRIFLQILCAYLKTLNMKVVCYMKLYNFCFEQKLI